VRELEQLLQSLEVQRSLKEHNPNLSNPFTGFFRFPQYSATSACHCHGGAGKHTNKEEMPDRSPQSPSVAADIEASMVEGHASVKVQAPRRPRQLLRLADGLQQLGLTTLHLNVSTAGTTVMYSFSLKVRDVRFILYTVPNHSTSCQVLYCALKEGSISGLLDFRFH
jgi:hypothetical protein